MSLSIGILVAKKKLFQNPVPTGCGGGTVFFVCFCFYDASNEFDALNDLGVKNVSQIPPGE